MRYFSVFACGFAVFRTTPPPMPPSVMVDPGAIIDVLYVEDYQTREDWNEDSHLPIEEPTERSQKVKRDIEVRHQEDKRQALSRQGIVWLPVKLENFSRSPSNSAASQNKAVAT